MQLRWIGDSRYVRGVGGWPASDHEEPDAKTARAKLKSKLYERVRPADHQLAADIEEPAEQEEAN